EQHGELLTLGIKVAPSTVWEILREAGMDPAPDRAATTWATFLRSQAKALLAADFIETVTLTGARMYILTVIESGANGRWESIASGLDRDTTEDVDLVGLGIAFVAPPWGGDHAWVQQFQAVEVPRDLIRTARVVRGRPTLLDEDSSSLVAL